MRSYYIASNWQSKSNTGFGVSPAFIYFIKRFYNILSFFFRYPRPSVINNYCNAIKLKPDYAEANNSCGVILKELKKHEDAIKSFNLAIKFNKNYAEAYYNLGHFFFERKKYNEALENFYESYKINPKLDYLLSSIIITKHSICEWSSFDEDLLLLENTILNEKK